jgi:hypothetical protein
MGDNSPEPLEKVVEVDETYVGGKFENMNRGLRKKWQESGKDNKVAVMGMVQRGGKAKLKVIGANTFKETVREHVDTSAFLVTDSHCTYRMNVTPLFRSNLSPLFRSMLTPW